MVVAGVLSVGLNISVRQASVELHSVQIVFFRGILGTALLAPIFLATGGIKSLATRHLHLHALRGAINAVAMFSLFAGVGMISLADVSALTFTAPLFATVMAAILLSERVGIRRQFGLAAGFLGTLILMRPGVEAMSLGGALVLLSAAAWAGSMIVIKILTRSDSSVAMTLYQSLFITAFAAIPALMSWRTPSMACFGWLIMVALMGVLSQIAVARAFAHAEAVVVLPFDFLQLLWATIAGYALYTEEPDLWTWIGGVVIFVSACYVAYGERAQPRRSPSG